MAQWLKRNPIIPLLALVILSSYGLVWHALEQRHVVRWGGERMVLPQVGAAPAARARKHTFTRRESGGEKVRERDGMGDSEQSQLRGERSRRPNDEQMMVHTTTLSNTGLFRAFQGYLVDNAEDLTTWSAENDHLTLFVYGSGEFTQEPRDPEGPLTTPVLECEFTPKGSHSTLVRPATVHGEGTAFRNKVSKSGRKLYFREKNVLISCGFGPIGPGNEALPQEEMSHSAHAGEVRIRSKDGKFFLTDAVKVEWFVVDATTEQRHELVQCSAPIHHLTGAKWLIEWIEYHLAMGFDHLHLYLFRNGVQESDILYHVVRHYINQGKVTAHDWSLVPEAPQLKGVELTSWEHAQRASRNDCYFRNRGVSKYIAFSDVDELWSFPPLEKDDLSMAAASFSPLIRPESVATRPIDRWLRFFDREHDANPEKIGFAFTSITVPPLPISRLVEDTPYLDKWHQKVVPEADFNLLIGQMQISEFQCNGHYNCGPFHKGRQKYMLRTAKGTIQPNVPLFYHAINEEYETIADPLMVKVPSRLGVLRHHAGHFKHSRLGGLLAAERVHFPLRHGILEKVRSAIDRQVELKKIYESEQREKFLGLDQFDDLWRFSKSTDDRTRAEAQHREDQEAAKAIEEKEQRSFMTFERFRGRLNNQLLNLDWAFRISLALRRTLFIDSRTVHHENWIGLPETLEEELHGTSLWNTLRLRSKFQFVTEYDIDPETHPVISKDYTTLPQTCVWSYALVSEYPEWKNIALWAKQASKRPECLSRIHFHTSDGLVHPYRTDTRAMGVGQFTFWKLIRPTDYLVRVAKQFYWESFKNRPVLAIHTRSHNSYGPEHFARSLKRCLRLVAKPLQHAHAFRQSAEKVCSDAHYKSLQDSDPFRDWYWPAELQNIDAIYQARLLEDTCNITPAMVDLALSYAKSHVEYPEDLGLFLASDHENPAVDELLYGLGAKSYTYDAEAVSKGDPARQVFTEEGRSHHDWRQNIQGVLLDMLLLVESDVFFGNPGSTLTQVVCFWRLARAADTLSEELSNTCGLVLAATGSSDPHGIDC